MPTHSQANSKPLDARAGVRIFHGINRIYSRSYHQIRVLSPSKLPRKGAAILVCNHISGLDPLMLQSVSNRVIVWMMAKEYYDIKALRWFYRTIEAIPVDRNGRDSAATRAALRALQNGSVLGIFPEGKIEPTRDLLPFQTGVAMMAHRAGVQVYPTYMDGTHRGKEMATAFLHANNVCLNFGPPVGFSSVKGVKPNLDISTATLEESVLKLKQEMNYK